MEIELFDGTILEFPEGTSDAVIDRAARQETISRRGANGGLTQIGTFADDGRILRRPDGSLTAVSAGGSTSDQATINRIMEGGSFAEISQDRFDNKIIDENKGIARLNEFVRGVPFVGEYVDEAVGKISPKAGEAMRRTTEAMQRQRPGETTALNVGGGIAGSVPLALAGGPALIEKARGMGRGARVAIGGLLGAIGGGTEGAISGYGSGENPEDRLANARSRGIAGGALGGILGGSGPLVADGAGALAEKAGNVYRGIGNSKVSREMGVSPQAADVLRGTFEGTDPTMSAATIARAGDNAMIGEVSPASRGLLDALAVRGNQARNVVNAAVDERVTTTNATMRGALDDAFGPTPAGIRSAADEIASRTGPGRKAAYDAAYLTPIDYASSGGRNIEDVFSRVPNPILKASIEAANEEIMSNKALRDAGIRQILADVADDGAVTFRDLPTVPQLDQIKRGLQSVAYRNTDTFGRLNPDGARYNRLAGELRDATIDATGGANGAYAKAVAAGGDKIAEDEALKLGSGIFTERVKREDVAQMMKNANETVRESARVGIRQQADEIMAQTRRVASDPNVTARQVNSVLGPLSAETTRTKLSLVLGESEYKNLFRQVDEMSEAFNLRAAVSENARTAGRIVAEGRLKDATSPNVVQQLMGGEAVDAAKSTVQLLTGETKTSQALRTDNVAEELARYLTQQRGETAQAAVRYLSQVSEGRNLTQAQANFVANTLAMTGYFAGTPASARALSNEQ
tara:strand:- start:130 stop:2373 length:2244 start_codon:yes stop_codon:yes gene_type:complete